MPYRSSGCALPTEEPIGPQEAARNTGQEPVLRAETDRSIGHREAVLQEVLRNNGQEAARNNHQEAPRSTRIGHRAARNRHRHRIRERAPKKAVGRQALGPNMNHKTRPGSRPFRQIRK